MVKQLEGLKTDRWAALRSETGRGKEERPNREGKKRESQGEEKGPPNTHAARDFFLNLGKPGAFGKKEKKGKKTRNPRGWGGGGGAGRFRVGEGIGI